MKRKKGNKCQEESVQEAENNSEKNLFENDDEEMILAYEEYEERQGDILKPTHIVNENIARYTIENYVRGHP